VLGLKAFVEHGVVVALVEDQDAVVLERGVELGQSAPAVGFVVQVGERVAEADDGVVLALDVAVEPAPVGLHRLEDQPALLAVVEGLRQHRGGAIGGGHVEARLGQAHRMEAGATGDVEHRLLAAGAQHVDEELALALGPRRPVDQLVPLLDEGRDVLALVEIGLPVGQRVLAVLLLLEHQFGVALLLPVERQIGVARLLLLGFQFGVALIQGCFGHDTSVNTDRCARAPESGRSCERARDPSGRAARSSLLCAAWASSPTGSRATETARTALTHTDGDSHECRAGRAAAGGPGGAWLRVAGAMQPRIGSGAYRRETALQGLNATQAPVAPRHLRLKPKK
jgi:hypothetical protein